MSLYFAMWQGIFDDPAAMRHAMQSAQGMAVAADVANGGAVTLHYAVKGS